MRGSTLKQTFFDTRLLLHKPWTPAWNRLESNAAEIVRNLIIFSFHDKFPNSSGPLIVTTTTLLSVLANSTTHNVSSGGKRRPDFQVQDNVHFHVIQIPVMTSGYPHEPHVVRRNRSILNLQQLPTLLTGIQLDVLPFWGGEEGLKLLDQAHWGAGEKEVKTVIYSEEFQSVNNCQNHQFQCIFSM